MSAIRETQTKVVTKRAEAPALAGVGTRAMDLLSGVRFGVVLLVLLAGACMVGMLVMQVNMDGFDKYYAALTPSQQLLYGKLGFFDIYHTWYFNALLLVLSLNIILSSIDHLPGAWAYVSRKKLDVSAHWLRGQEQHAVLTLEGGRPATQSPDYNNPAAALRVTNREGGLERAYAFRGEGAEGAPLAGRAVAGYKFRLADFERVGDAHILSVQKDPGATVVYAGFLLLTLTLGAVFFFAHQRVWARVEPGAAGGFEVTVGGNTNRNKLGFEDRFRKLVKAITE